jgi:hypothetical protein
LCDYLRATTRILQNRAELTAEFGAEMVCQFRKTGIFWLFQTHGELRSWLHRWLHRWLQRWLHRCLRSFAAPLVAHVAAEPLL